MIGLPGDSREKAMITAKRVVELSPDFIRIYPTLVFEGSRLARLYRTGQYQPLEMDECVSIVKDMSLVFRKRGIPVIRMGLHISSDVGREERLLAGPHHPAFGQLVFSSIFLDQARSILNKKKISSSGIIIRVHTRAISNMRGLKNHNVKILKKDYGLASIKILPDSAVMEDLVLIDGEGES